MALNKVSFLSFLNLFNSFVHGKLVNFNFHFRLSDFKRFSLAWFFSQDVVIIGIVITRFVYAGQENVLELSRRQRNEQSVEAVTRQL